MAQHLKSQLTGTSTWLSLAKSPGPMKPLTPIEFGELSPLGRERALRAGLVRTDVVDGTNLWHIVVEDSKPNMQVLGMLVNAGCDINYVDHAGHSPLGHLFWATSQRYYTPGPNRDRLMFMLEAKATWVVPAPGRIKPFNALNNCPSRAVDLVFELGAGWYTNACDGSDSRGWTSEMKNRLLWFWTQCGTELTESDTLLPPLRGIVMQYLLDTPDLSTITPNPSKTLVLGTRTDMVDHGPDT